MCFFFQAEDGIRDLVRSRGLGDVYKRQVLDMRIAPNGPVVLTEIHLGARRLLQRLFHVLGPAQGIAHLGACLLYTSPSPRDRTRSRMPSSA